MQSSAEQLLMLAQGGSREPLGRLMERYRNYLKILAAGQLHARLQVRANASDVVQEAFLHAYQAFHQFRGQTVGEFVGWLRQILGNLAQLRRAASRTRGTARQRVGRAS